MTAILFVLNPGSTSTKTALFRDRNCLYEQTVRHQTSEMHLDGPIIRQLPVRLSAVAAAMEQALAQNDLAPADITAFVGRGGLIRSVPSGTYRIGPDMLADLEMARYGSHASNLGAIIAARLAAPWGKPAYIVDPPSVDEMFSLARLTGLPQMRRKSAFHALNQKAVARLAADSIGKPYAACNLIVAHLGGGISVGAHRAGQVIDVNNALEEGPFSPERSGTLPTQQLVDLCFSGRLPEEGIRRLLVGEGGLYAYTGTTDCRQIEEQMGSRPEYKELLEAMAYQIAKSIGAMAVSLGGQIDAIILTGGLAHSTWLTAQISGQVAFLGRILVLPGEHELAALAGGALRVLNGEEPGLEYVRDPLPLPEPATVPAPEYARS